MYRGWPAFLIAGGPSFLETDRDALSKAPVYTMALNNACRTFRPNAGCIVDDPCRFVASLWLDPKIQKFVPTSHFEKPLWDNRTIIKKDGTKEPRWMPMNLKVGDCPNVVGYRRNEKLVPARYLYEDTINWGNHKQWGGGRSVLLASMRILFLLGFRTVYLLGVDFEMNKEKKYHFNEGRTDAAINGNMSTYDKMIKWFDDLQKYFLAENFIIKNCNPNSRLKAFPSISFSDALYEAGWMVGDLVNERTDGMYIKWEEKLAEWQRTMGAGGLPQALPPPMQPPTEPPDDLGGPANPAVHPVPPPQIMPPPADMAPPSPSPEDC
jgi:hypothetical protein